MKQIACILATILFASSIFAQEGNCLQNQDHPGYKSITQSGSAEIVKREYILHVPINHDVALASPLVINLHGFGDCASYFFEDVGNFYQFNQMANEENILVAYPQAAYRPEKEDHYWEPGDTGVEDIYKNDVYFIDQLIAEIDMEYNVDLNKVYAIGYSNGGMMVYSLACNRSQVFAGVGIMSGTMLEEDCTLDNAVPIIAFHGVDDEVLPYDGSIYYQSVAEVVDFWLFQNDIPASSLVSTELNDGKVLKDEYKGMNENSCLQLYTIVEEYDKPGGHVWFSDKIEGLSPNKIMWDFFEASCDPISSIDEVDDSIHSLKLHPNPMIDQLTIESESIIDQHFEIFDIYGNVRSSGRMNASPYVLDISCLPPDIYILTIGDVSRKVLKID